MTVRIAIAVIALAASAAEADGPALDGMGRAMLDPLRVETLQPDETIHRVGIRSDAVVADVGAGPGFWTLPLARAAKRVLALDVRRDYLDVAAARAQASGLRNVTTRVVDASECGLAAASVDLIWVSQVDHYLKDRARYFAGLGRALRPRGRVVLINYEQYRDADVAAAARVGLRIVDEWRPSAAFFVLVLASDR